MSGTDHPLALGRRRSQRQLSYDDIGNQGRVLLNEFISERMRNEGLQSIPAVEELTEPGTPSGPPMGDVHEIGRALRYIADELDQDQKLRGLINQVSPDAPHDTFLKVANEVFSDGLVSWGRIVTLFYFGYKMVVKFGLSTKSIITNTVVLIKFLRVIISTVGIEVSISLQAYLNGNMGNIFQIFRADGSFCNLNPAINEKEGARIWYNVTRLGQYMYMYVKGMWILMAIDKLPLIRAIINWVINFIVDKAATWILEKGGWEAIREYFGTPGRQAIAILATGVLVGVGIYMYKSS